MAGEVPFASESDVLSCFTSADTPSVSISRITTLISQTSALIRHRCPGYSSAPAEVLKLVTCRVVCRALRSRGDGVPGDVSQLTQSTGPFSTSMSWNSSVGEVFLTRQDRDDINGYSAAFFGDVDTLFGTTSPQPSVNSSNSAAVDTPPPPSPPPPVEDNSRINRDQGMDHL